MYPSLTFNGTRKTGVYVTEKKRPYWAPRQRSLLEIEGMDGAYLNDTKKGVLIITAKIMLSAESPYLLRRLAEEVAEWFDTKKAVPLQFDDETERTYYAVVEGALDPDEMVTIGFVDIIFLCTDPYKYGVTRTVPVTEDIMTIKNNGSAETKPLFRFTALAPLTNIDIVTPTAYMRVGAPARVEQTPVEYKSTVLASELTSTTGWSVAQVADNGYVTGTMGSDAQGFIASTWGESQTPFSWQGPALVKSLPAPIQDFITQVNVRLLNGVDELGMIEIYMLDASGNVVGKMGLEDVWRRSKVNQAKFQLGMVGVNRWERHGTSEYPPAWNDFTGVLQLRREGIAWDAYFAEVDGTGKHYNVENWRYWDHELKYAAPVAQVQIALRKWGDGAVPAAGLRVNRIDVWQINDTTPEEPLFIAQTGDVVEIDHSTGNVTVNGEPRLWLKDLGSTYFPIEKGDNTLSISPAHLMDGEIIWRERYG